MSSRAAYHKHKAQGACVKCGSEASGALCRVCRKIDRERVAHRYKSRVERGLCIRCGGERERGAYCHGCHNEMRSHSDGRRALRASVQFEAVDREAVFVRDGWRCQICGRHTPRSRSGTRHGNAPELDHRVPIARGGTHTYDNVQCACRRCNLRKLHHSNVGQLPIWSTPQTHGPGP